MTAVSGVITVEERAQSSLGISDAEFQDFHYLAQLTALLPIDLVRMAGEAGLVDAQIHYTNSCRIVFTPPHYPKSVARRFPHLLSDNLFCRCVGLYRS